MCYVTQAGQKLTTSSCLSIHIARTKIMLSCANTTYYTDENSKIGIEINEMNKNHRIHNRNNSLCFKICFLKLRNK